MSWEEYKKKREQESSWAKYKQQRDYERQQKEQAQIEQNKLLEKLNLPTKTVQSNPTVAAPNSNSQNDNLTNVRNSMATSLSQQLSKATTTKDKGIITSISDIGNRIEADRKNKNIAKGGEDAFNEYMDSTLNAIPGGTMSVISGIVNAGTSLVGAGVKGLQSVTNNENVEEKLQETYDNIVNIGKNIHQRGNATNLVNSYVDNDFTRESSNVVHTVSSQLTTYLLSLVLGIPAALIQGTYVGGASAQEVLNENKDNAGRAVLTGVGKGLASYELEKLTGGNILGKGSFDDMAVGFITNNFSSKAGQKVASKIYEVGGEVFEENLENAIDMVIDNVVNQKGYSVKDWWNELGETSKGTILATIALNLLGLGGDTYNKVQEYKLDSQAKKMIKEAETLIEKENLKIDFDKMKDHNKNTTTNLQPQSMQNTQNTPSQQVIPMQEEGAQNAISEQTVKRNIIDEKVNEYINQNRSNFKTNINIETKVVNDGEPMETNYKNAKETAIYQKAKNLFNKIGLKQFKNNNDTIYVTNQDIKESIRKTIKNPSQKRLINENIAVFSSLDKIINNAKELDVAQEHKDRSQYNSWKYYISEVNIDNKPYVVEFDTVLREDGQRHFRLERVYDINNIGDSKTTLLAPKANEVVRYGISFYY